MNAELLKKLERLAASQIELVPFDAISNHYVLSRDGCVAFVEKRQNDFGKVGAPGTMTEKGFACLVWREQSAFFVAKGFEQPATDEQIANLRKFSEDLNQALAK